MKEIAKKNWTYILYESKGKLLFSVICGSVAMFDRNIYLGEDEIAEYNLKKEGYLDALAEEIRSNPDNYLSRHVKI